MFARIILLFFVITLALSARASQDATTVSSSAPFVPARPPHALAPPQTKLAYSVVIENKAGGIIRIVDPPAQFLLHRPGVDIGTVLRPATSVDTKGYHASSWGARLSVVASAVNAVHLKVYDDERTGRAGVITLLPAELHGHTLEGAPSALRGDAMYTDIPGGHGLFGGSYPVIVGNPVSIYRNGQEKLSFDPERVELLEGDVLIVEVRTPSEWPQGLQIENRPGGALTLVDSRGTTINCGSVSKAVTGSGRFEGGVFCESGGIRATHTAVLDLDFSPVKCTGGIQLIPEAHSRSAELTYSQTAPPYGILLGPEGNDLRAQPPLFGGYLYPSSHLETPVLLPILVVSVQLDGDPAWQALPSLVGRSTLEGLHALRVDWVLPALRAAR